MNPHFLIVKASAIGDIIQSFPVMDYLKKKFPSCRIDWVVEKKFAPLVASHPNVDRTIVADTHSWRQGVLGWAKAPPFLKTLRQTSYAAAFDLQGNIKSGLILALCKTKARVGFGWKNLAEKPSWFFVRKHVAVPEGLDIRRRYLAVVQGFFQDKEPFTPGECRLYLDEQDQEKLRSLLNSQDIPVMVAFGSKWPNKQVPIPHLIRFLQQLANDQKIFFYFIWASPAERLIAEALHRRFPKSLAVGDLSFSLWQALMREMSVVIAMDSAALHLCATTSTPSLSFFGPSLASIYKPEGEQHRFLQGSCPYGRIFTQRCPVLRTCPTGACMQGFSIQQMVEEFDRCLTERCR